jgi:hypothetical protein
MPMVLLARNFNRTYVDFPALSSFRQVQPYLTELSLVAQVVHSNLKVGVTDYSRNAYLNFLVIGSDNLR